MASAPHERAQQSGLLLNRQLRLLFKGFVSSFMIKLEVFSQPISLTFPLICLVLCELAGHPSAA